MILAVLTPNATCEQICVCLAFCADSYRCEVATLESGGVVVPVGVSPGRESGGNRSGRGMSLSCELIFDTWEKSRRLARIEYAHLFRRDVVPFARIILYRCRGICLHGSE